MSDDFWSLGTLAALLFLGLEDLGRVEVCSREMWQRCGHCWRQKCQHVADRFAATVEANISVKTEVDHGGASCNISVCFSYLSKHRNYDT